MDEENDDQTIIHNPGLARILFISPDMIPVLNRKGKDGENPDDGRIRPGEEIIIRKKKCTSKKSN